MGRAIAATIVLILSTGSRAGADAGLGDAIREDYRNESISGLCVTENEAKDYYQRGVCLSLFEMFTQKDCVKELVEKIRLRYLKGHRDEKDLKAADRKKYEKLKDDEKKDMNINLECTSEKNLAGTDRKPGIADVVEDPAKFSNFLMQFFMAVGVNETNLDPKYNEKQSGPMMPAGNMKLTLEDMDDEKYYCGCHVTNSKGEGNSAPGDSPGPLDEHHSIMCGAYMGLYHAAEDGVLFEGSSKETGEDGKPTAKGAARKFKTLDAASKTAGEDTPQFKILRGKLKKYCEKFAGADSKKVIPFSDQYNVNSGMQNGEATK